MNRPEGPTHIGHIVHLIEWQARQAAISNESEIASELRDLAFRARTIAVDLFGYRMDDLLAGDYAIHA